MGFEIALLSLIHGQVIGFFCRLRFNCLGLLIVKPNEEYKLVMARLQLGEQAGGRELMGMANTDRASSIQQQGGAQTAVLVVGQNHCFFMCFFLFFVLIGMGHPLVPSYGRQQLRFYTLLTASTSGGYWHAQQKLPASCWRATPGA
jgi:hypothetical protein